MIRKLAAIILLFGVMAAGVFWWVTRPASLSAEQRASLSQGDAVAGEAVFWAGGCGSCHAEKSARGDDKKLLGGGHRLDTPAGIFVTPNISPDRQTGIGAWSLEEFANAMWNGVSPDGRHYFPSFPYTSYARMTGKDMADLFAYLMTLEAVERENEPHELPLPFRLRRGIGVWKFAFAPDPAVPFAAISAGDEMLERGRYLVEGMAHCGECHTPRTIGGFGGMDASRWLAGGPAPEGLGSIPNITPHQAGLASWSAGEIEAYLETGFTPDFDSVGGTMVSVQENMARLAKADRAAIAAYLKAVPPAE